MSNDPIIETRALSKRYGRKLALDRLDLAIPRGRVHAIVGANGAGKSTLFRILLGFMPPSAGEARILGKDSQQLTPQDRARIGFVNEEHTLPGWMRVSQVVAMQRHQYGRWNQPAFDGVIGHYHVLPEQKVSQLSRGERAGFNLALALAQKPELLVLDEPTLGLDVVAKRAFLESLLYSNATDDCTVVYCSHQMEEIERVADNLIILERGELKHMSAPEDVHRARQPLGRRRAVQGAGAAHRARPAGNAAHRRPAPLPGAGPGRGLRAVPARRRRPPRAVDAGQPGPRRQRLPGQEPRRPGSRLSARHEDTNMIDLFKGELLRFRLWATAAAILNVAVLGFLSRMVDLAQQPLVVYQVFAAVYAVAGILLGMYQMGSYRKPGQWLNLLHRPLHRLRIAGGLTGAGALLLLLAVAVPVALVAMYQGTMTARVVDLRHWMLPVAAWLIAVSRLPRRRVRDGRQSPLFVRRVPAAQPVHVRAGRRAWRCWACSAW